MALTEAEAALAIAAIEKILAYGVPAFINAVQGWQVENPTVEDILALKIEGKTEDYFTKK